MKLKVFVPFTLALFGFCVAAQAGRVVGSSNYGNEEPTTSCDPGCLGELDGATVTGEFFTSAEGPLVYDFKVTLAGSYDVTLTSTDLIDPDNFGLLTCDPTNPVQCSNELPPGITTGSDYGTLDGTDKIATFDVSNALAGSDTYVFFVQLQNPQDPVTINIAPATSTVPEPRMLPLLGLGMLAAFVFFRRWRLAR
jgi:hypothetical protein